MRKFRTAVRAVREIRNASRRYDIGYLTTVRRFVRLYLRRFSPKEIELYDLLNPRNSDETLERCLSRDESLRLDAKHVLAGYLCVTNDKSVFYALCTAAGIPSPRLIAIFDHPAGWTPDGQAVREAQEWCAFFRTLPERFIVKPAMGLQGRGVCAFNRQSDRFVGSDGTSHTAEQLHAFLCAQRSGNLFGSNYSHHSLRLPNDSHKVVIQEQLFAHGEIAELTGTDALCTARVMTKANGAGEIEVVGCALRLINGNGIVDNYDSGAHGNLWCSVATRSGKIVDALGTAPNSRRLGPIAQHPVTGKPILGFHVPQWDEALDLARRLASIVRPQSLVTWDIGITRNGPVAIEGNLGALFLPTPLDRRFHELLEP